MDLIHLLIAFIALELFESKWQKHETLYGLIYNNYQIYKKNIFLYFILHVTFFYSLFIMISLNKFDFWMISIVGMKFLDMAFKLNMMKNLNNGSEIHELMPINIKMTPLFRYFNVIIYPLSFAFSFGIIYQ